MADPADLSLLADIVMPQPVPWWPPAPGWWVLAAAVAAAAGILARAAQRHHRRNAYRRAALTELAGMGTIVDAAGVAAVSAVLKRAALAAHPRSEVASLTGPAWAAFLDRTGEFFGATLTRAAFGGAVTDGDAVLAAARRWVRRHRVGA